MTRIFLTWLSDWPSRDQGCSTGWPVRKKVLALPIILFSNSFLYLEIIRGLMCEEMRGPDWAAIGVDKGAVKQSVVVVFLSESSECIIERQIHNLNGDQDIQRNGTYCTHITIPTRPQNSNEIFASSSRAVNDFNYPSIWPCLTN